MRQSKVLKLGFLFMLGSFCSFADQCPEPQTTSLQWGQPPYPWVENPYSLNKPQGEEHTLFVHANILVAGYGQGVICTYRNSVGDYSIWQPRLTKIPASSDHQWIKSLGGFICSQSLVQCEFELL